MAVRQRELIEKGGKREKEVGSGRGVTRRRGKKQGEVLEWSQAKYQVKRHHRANGEGAPWASSQGVQTLWNDLAELRMMAVIYSILKTYQIRFRTACIGEGDGSFQSVAIWQVIAEITWRKSLF